MKRADSLEKTLMLGKIKDRRGRGQQRMKWLDGLTCSRDMNLSKLWEMVKKREVWRAAVHEVTVRLDWGVQQQRQVALVVKNLPANAGNARDVSSMPGLRRSPGVGDGNPLQYSCLGNPMDRGACRAIVHGVAKSWTQLSTHTHEPCKLPNLLQISLPNLQHLSCEC